MSEADTRITGATLDAPSRVTLRLNRRVYVGEWPRERFRLKTSTGLDVPLQHVEAAWPRHDQTTTFHLDSTEPLDFVHNLYEVWVEGAGSRLISVRDVLLDPQQYFDPTTSLGAWYSPQQTVFRLFAPTCAGVEVIVVPKLVGDEGLAAHEMRSIGKGVWEATVEGNWAEHYYAFRLRGIGFNPRDEIADIYALCRQGLGPRSLIVDMRKLDPPGFREQTFKNCPPTDAVVYELHVRDFTISRDSGIAHRGKFLGLAEAGTRLARDPSICTGLDHLVELGVTHVQIMPVHDFDNREDRQDEYHWGYMPVAFNSPDGWYASSVAGSARISEFKQVVQALHQRGIGVILDVVYNHTAKAAAFERLVPNYYYRKTPADRFCNGSGCGNEFMSEAPMGRRFIIDSLKMWLEEYRVDGFRFDLLGLIDIETVRQIKAELSRIRPDVLLWGEPWTGGATPLKPITDRHQLRGVGVASFNDSFRDAIKGDRDGGPPGFVQNGSRIDVIRSGLKGAIHEWADQPSDCVNYFECHDNLTTWDKLVQSAPDASEADLERMARFAAMILFSSQGIVFLQSGQEMRRTKRGHCNSYNLPDAINQIDWTGKKRYRGLHDYYRGLIALRKAHPAFRLPKREDIEYRVWFGDVPNDRCIAHILHCVDLPGESAQAIVILHNGSDHWEEFRLGEGTWAIYADADRAGTEVLATVQSVVGMPAHSGMILGR